MRWGVLINYIFNCQKAKPQNKEVLPRQKEGKTRKNDAGARKKNINSKRLSSSVEIMMVSEIGDVIIVCSIPDPRSKYIIRNRKRNSEIMSQDEMYLYMNSRIRKRFNPVDWIKFSIWFSLKISGRWIHLKKLVSYNGRSFVIATKLMSTLVQITVMQIRTGHFNVTFFYSLSFASSSKRQINLYKLYGILKRLLI